MRIGLWLVLSFALAGWAGAQPGQGTVAGTVTDETGRPLIGAAITLTGGGNGFRRSTTSDAEGRYSISGVPIGPLYDVVVEMSGFTSSGHAAVALVPGAATVVDFELMPSLAETVSVWAPAPSYVDRAALQQTINERLVHAVPLLGRSFLDLVSLTAGFTGNPSFPSPLGQMFWSNNVLVDGASHFSKWRSAARAFHSGYGLEAIKEVQVLTSRYSAEFGEALASVTSVVTQAGTNEFRGSALLFVQDDHFEEPPVFAAAKPDHSAARYGVTAGGPLARDRTFLFASYEGRRSRSHNIVVSPLAAGAAVPDDEDEQLLFARVDHQNGPEHLMALRYNRQRFDWHNEPGGLSLPGTGTAYQNDVDTILFTDTFRAGSSLLGNVRGQFARYRDIRRDVAPSVYVSRAGYSAQGGSLGPFGFGADPEDTGEAAGTFLHVRRTHALKFGGGVRHVRAHNFALSYGNGAYFFSSGGSDRPYLFVQSLVATGDQAMVDPRSVSAQLFVQDDWRVSPALTLTLGARYDVETIRHVRGFGGADTNNVQPRVGAAWSPSSSGRLTVRGGGGFYTQQHLLYEINRVQLEGPDGGVMLTLPPDSPLFPTFPNAIATLPLPHALPPRDVHQVVDDFSNPYSVQASAGVEWLVYGTAVSADYVWLNGYDLMSLVDANAPASNVKPLQRSVAEADATRPVVPIAGGYRKMVTLGNEGRSWYRALQIKAGRSRGRLHAVASYTWASAEDQASYVLPEDSRNLAAEHARADNDLRHNLVMGFAVDLPGRGPVLGGWALSGLGAFRSNRPYTITWGDDRNGTTQNDARPGARNTGRTGAYRNLDLALVRRFAVGPRAIEARVEVFNVTNTTNYADYAGALSSPFYSRPVSAFPTRRVQFAALLRF
jgi:hypothetical protein